MASAISIRSRGLQGIAKQGWVDRMVSEVLPVTAWLEPGHEGDAYPVVVQFSGRRVGCTGRRRPGDRFSQVETVEQVVPGSGPVSVTTIVRGINPGEWAVQAQPIIRGKRRSVPGPRKAVVGGRSGVGRLQWPWKYRIMSAEREATAKTTLPPFASAPGVIPCAYASFVAAGILLGLTLQALVLARSDLGVRSSIAVSAMAVLTGIAGAKSFYVLGHGGRRYDGWCIQGFIFGAALVSVALASRLPIPLGVYLDSMVPGLLVGMAIGRVGCFLAGCCRGRPTASRWGVWSSDQRVGARRIPTQLLESALALSLGIGASILVLSDAVGRSGAVFVGALALYTLGRQFVLPFRQDPRHLRFGRSVVLVITASLAIVDALWAAHLI